MPVIGKRTTTHDYRKRLHGRPPEQKNRAEMVISNGWLPLAIRTVLYPPRTVKTAEGRQKITVPESIAFRDSFTIFRARRH